MAGGACGIFGHGELKVRQLSRRNQRQNTVRVWQNAELQKTMLFSSYCVDFFLI